MAEDKKGKAPKAGTSELARLLILINVLVLALLAWGLISALRPSDGPPPEFTLEDAVEDAMSLSAGNAYDGLNAITPDNSSLHWDNSDPQSPRVLVATWTRYQGYQKHLSEGCTLSQEVWVTPVAQVQGACRRFGLSGPELEDRLARYLGLSLDKNYTFVAEMWVDPRELFRPCADPEINDRECDPGLPELSNNPTPEELAHAQWFKKQVDEYYSENPLPWTRYGYTYDWADPTRKVGASEYIIRSGAAVHVSSTTPTEEYCSPNANLPRTPPPDSAAFSDGC